MSSRSLSHNDGNLCPSPSNAQHGSNHMQTVDGFKRPDSPNQNPTVQPDLDPGYAGALVISSNVNHHGHAYPSATAVCSQSVDTTLGAVLEAGLGAAPANGATSDDALSDKKRHRVSRACDECRRKKIRCDAHAESNGAPVQACSSCKRSSLNCSFSRVPMKRGPSKGYIKELEQRLNSLENALGRDVTLGSAISKIASTSPSASAIDSNQRGKRDDSYPVEQNYQQQQQSAGQPTGGQQYGGGNQQVDEHRNQFYQPGYSGQSSQWIQDFSSGVWNSFQHAEYSPTGSSSGMRTLDHNHVKKLYELYTTHLKSTFPIIPDLDVEKDIKVVSKALQNVLRVYFDPCSNEQDIQSIAGQVVASPLAIFPSGRLAAIAFQELTLLAIATDRAIPTQAGISMSLYLLGAANTLCKMFPHEFGPIQELLHSYNGLHRFLSNGNFGTGDIAKASPFCDKIAFELFDLKGRYPRECDDDVLIALQAIVNEWISKSGNSAASDWIKFSPDAHQALVSIVVALAHAIASETEKKMETSHGSTLEEVQKIAQALYDRLVDLLRSSIATETIDNNPKPTSAKEKAFASVTTISYPRAWYILLKRVLAKLLGYSEPSEKARSPKGALEQLASVACADPTSKRKRVKIEREQRRRIPSIAIGWNDSEGFCSDDVVEWIAEGGVKGALFAIASI